MVAFALLTVATSFAYEIGDYAYNTTQRFKITGENKVTNGDFASNNRDGWYGADKETSPNAEVWDLVQGAGPKGETVIKSLAAEEGQPFANSWQLDAGSYIVSIDVKAPTAVNTTINAGQNSIDFFINTTGSLTKEASTDEAPVKNVSGGVFVPAEEWQTLVWLFTLEQGESLVMRLEKLAADFQFTNIAIHQAIEVYDTRIAERRIAFARLLMEDSNFNTAEAQDAKANLVGIIETLEGMMAAGEMDDASQAETFMASFEDEAFAPFLDVTSQNLKSNKFFNYIEDITKMPNYNRGSISDGQQIGGFLFRGSDWQHGSYRDANNTIISGNEWLMKQIQGSYTTNAGSVSLANANLPAGKYFIAANVRNAYCDKDYNLTWSLETPVKAFVGKDSVDCGTIVGQNYVRLYTIGEVKEGESMEAGFYWANTATSGARFEIRDFEIRSFEDVLTPFNHNEAWNAFFAQYNAAVNARKAIIEKIDNAEYPWGQDSLKAALATWDPYYEAIVAKGWITEEGTDAGIATTDELNDWALYQGVALYNEEGAQLEYQLVRGYQNANNYATEANKVITDFATAIASAEAVLNDPQNGQGDKATFQAVIDAAKAILEDIQKNTNDSRREADEARIQESTQALADATEVFKASATIVPFIDIDFSNQFQLEEFETESGVTDNYYILGTAGKINFGSSVNPEVNTGTLFALGTGEELLDVLRVGNAMATVDIAEADQPNADQVIRFSFDVWFGKLSGKSLYVNLVNAAGQRVAGFQYERYNNVVTYNDFDNAEGTGFPINNDHLYNISNVNNASICTDANKTHIDLLVDYKAQAVQGILESNRGTFTGELVPFRTYVEDALDEGVEGTLLEDTKVVQFVLGSNYNNEGRRCWFDNLQVKKYASAAEGPIETGVKEIVAPSVNAAIYTISGLKVNKITKPGLYIQNGKKFVVK